MFENLWDEAAKTAIFGKEVYTYGLYLAAGTAAALLALCFFSWLRRCKRGTGAVTSLMSLLSGLIFGRLGFCLMNQELGGMMPLFSWIRIDAGGFSMFGVIFGAFFGAFLSAKITGQEPGKLLDITATSLPIFTAAERWGEWTREEFDISRALKNDLLKGSFLAVGDGSGEEYLATYRLAAILAAILFLILLANLLFSAHHGNSFRMFLLLFGAGGVICESLRYDRYLSVTFVGLQEILAILMLAVGIILLVKETGKAKPALCVAAILSVILAVGGGVALEFALDRTSWNPFLTYGLMVLVMGIPAVLGLLLLKERGNS